MLDVGVLVQYHLDLKKRRQYLHVFFALLRVPAMKYVIGHVLDSKKQYHLQLADQRRSVVGADPELIQKHDDERLPYLFAGRPAVMNEL